MAIFRRRSPTSPNEKQNGGSKESSTFLPRLTLSIMHLLALIFLILVEIGTINNKAVIRSTWFLKINLANLIPKSVPNAVLINSIARTIGLHDFYQVGLWGFCEGYNDQGITSCSKPKTLYWFNPVEIILNELLAGATIALPGNIVTTLNLVRTVSHWMFACYLVGVCLTFVCIFLAPLGVSSRPHYLHRGRRIFGREIPLIVLTFLALLFTAVASVIATVMFIIFRNVFTSATELNIGAELGKPMLAFMWIAVGFNLISFLWQLFTCFHICCCSGKRKAKRKGLLDGSNGGAGTGSMVNNEAKSGNGISRRFGWRSRRLQT